MLAWASTLGLGLLGSAQLWWRFCETCSARRLDLRGCKDKNLHKGPKKGLSYSSALTPYMVLPNPSSNAAVCVWPCC